MMKSFDTEDALLKGIRAIVPDRTALLVSVDGHLGAGKTQLLKILQEGLDFRTLDLDGYLERDQGGYLEFLDYKRFKSDIRNIKGKGYSVAVSGICILEVLERIGMKPDIRIYIKLFDLDGSWIGENLCDHSRDLHEVLTGIQQEQDDGRHQAYCNLDQEITRYHHKFRPAETSDILFSKTVELDL